MSKRYLYSHGYCSTINRYEIIDESKASYFIPSGINGRNSIRKKTMRIGQGFSCTYYYEETEELKEKFRIQELKRKYIDRANKLSFLCKKLEESEMVEVIDIYDKFKEKYSKLEDK